MENVIDIGLVCLTGFSTPEASDRFRWLAKKSYFLSSHQDVIGFLEALSRCRKEHPHVAGLIDLECIGGIAKGMNLLLALREVCSDIPLILTSERTKYSDLSTERLCICDATLKSPFTTDELEVALVAAKVNNYIFNNRRARTSATNNDMGDDCCIAGDPSPSRLQLPMSAE